MAGLLGIFLNPWALAAAGLLASVPVIIHLINRMRYRRVRWAAMEFLLAAQKRMKRKMIIEQLLLLASRVLLVILIGLLLSRWLIGGSPPALPEDWILHEVVLDDSTSMSDSSRDAGAGSDSFALAKDGIRSLAESSLVSKIPTRMRLRRASDPGKILFDEQLGDESFGALVEFLNSTNLRSYRVNLIDALEVAKNDLIGQFPDLKTRKLLHFFSDVRKADWSDGKIKETMNSAEAVQWRIHDCAVPIRDEQLRPDQHGNLAILALGSESRLGLEGQPLECWAKVANFGAQPRSAFLAIELNGKRDPSASRQIESLPSGQIVEVRFRIIPSRGGSTVKDGLSPNDAKTGQAENKDALKDGLARRASSSPMAIRAILENDSGEGVPADNIRDMVLEVRDRIPLLIVDGTIQPGASTSSDSLYFGAALNPQLFEPIFLEPADLEKQDMPSFALVVLLNVAELTDTAVVKLDNYVKSGGGLAWFAGDRTVSGFCNRLFEQHDGLFPVLLAGQASPILSEKEREEMKRDESPKVVFPDLNNPVVAGLLPFRQVFKHLRMERHWPSIESSRWNDQTETLLALPSKAWQIAGQREALKREILDIFALDKSPFTLPAIAPVLGILELEIGKTRSKIATSSQFEIVRALEDLLRLQQTGEGTRIGQTVWDLPELIQVQDKLKSVIRKIQQGDPLMVARPIGRGNVLAFLSSAGPASSRSGLTGDSIGIWNEWANGFLSATFPILVQDSLFYLLRQNSDSRSKEFSLSQSGGLGNFPSPVVMESLYYPQQATVIAGKSIENSKVFQVATKIFQNPEALWSIGIDSQQNPGLLTYSIRPDSTSVTQVRGAVAFNVDTFESDLKRASQEEVDPRTGKSKAETSADWFKFEPVNNQTRQNSEMLIQKRSLDASETPWLIVALLALLIVEQFLAWRCSHIGGNLANFTSKGVA